MGPEALVFFFQNLWNFPIWGFALPFGELSAVNAGLSCAKRRTVRHTKLAPIELIFPELGPNSLVKLW